MIHHVGILARTVESVLCPMAMPGEPFFLEAEHHIPQWNCTCYMYKFTYGDSSRFEVVVPSGGRLLDWLNLGHGPIHHIAILVPDVQARTNRLIAQGVHMVSPTPVPGVGGTLVNFIHPAEYGLMVELVEVL